MKKIAIAVLAMAVSAPSFADQQVIDSVIGAVAGGAGARALYHGDNNRKRNQITAVGALGGAWLGSKIGDDSERHHQERLQMQQRGQDMQYESSYQNRYVAPVQTNYGGNYVVSRPSRVSARYDTPYTPIPRDEYREEVQVTYRNRNVECGVEYADPEAARAYCAGRAEFIRQAYERGARGR